MPEYDAEEARRLGEERINEQLRLDVPGYIEKQTSNIAAEQDLIAKNTMDTASYNELAQHNAERVLKVQAAMRKQGEAYSQAMEHVTKLTAKQLENELKTNNLLYKRKGLINDIRAMEAKQADDRQKFRVQQAQEELAQVKALEKEGIEPSQLAGGVSPRMTPESLILAGKASASGRALHSFERTRVGGYLGRQAAEIGGIESLASPAGLMNLVRANPVVSAGFAGLEAFQVAQNFEQQGIGGVPLIGRFLAQIPGARPLTAFGETTRMGQMTGEGYGAGLGAALRGFQLGANPFDIVSGEVANSIVRAVRSQGFRGAMAREFESSIKDIYKDTGLPVEEIAQMGEIFARAGRLDEFNDSMERLGKIAKESNQSIQNVAATFQQLQEALVGQGGIANADLVRALTDSISSIAGLSTAQRSQVTQFFAQGAGTYTGFTGVAATTPMAQRIFRQQLGRILPTYRANLENLPREVQDQQLANMIQAGLLPGITSVDAARKLIQQGPQMLRNLRSGLTEARVGRLFAGARGARRTAESEVLDRISANLGTRISTTTVGRRAEAREIQRRLLGAGVSETLSKDIGHDLLQAAGGRGDWGAQMERSRRRVGRVVGQMKSGDDDYKIGLTPEARRFFDVRKQRKRNQLDQAFEGVARTVGTAFSNSWPG